MTSDAVSFRFEGLSCLRIRRGRLPHLCYSYIACSVGLADIPVFNEYPDVFPDEIPGFASVREVEFGRELVSRLLLFLAHLIAWRVRYERVEAAVAGSA